MRGIRINGGKMYFISNRIKFIWWGEVSPLVGASSGIALRGLRRTPLSRDLGDVPLAPGRSRPPQRLL